MNHHLNLWKSSPLLKNKRYNIEYIATLYMSWIFNIGQSTHYIQAWKIFTTKSASDISLTAYVICLLLLIHWVIYGILIKNRVIIIAEILGIIGSILVIIGVIIYS